MRFPKEDYWHIRFIRPYCVPGTANVLHKRGDIERMRPDIAEGLIENGYAVPYQEPASGSDGAQEPDAGGAS